ncbi:MAG: PQQ-like beta-propeller repeat protein [Gemmatimonadaceae bacterium]|nr:PQQ-like beta-propeller repeat protein [Gemmatimonadaceae bacterium]
MTPLLAMSLFPVGCHESTGPASASMKLLWASARTNAGQDWINGTPAADAGRVYIQEGNSLVGLDAATGARLWSRRIRFAAAPPPTTLVADGGVVYLSETDSVMAVDGATGRTLWNMHPDSQAVVVPALDATTFYTGQRGIAVAYALDRATGALRWKQRLITGSPYPAHIRGLAVSGDTVYVNVEKSLDPNGAASKGVLVALDRLTGAELWRFETAGSRDYFYGAPLLAGNRVIVNDIYAGPLIAIDTRTHTELWRADAGGAPRVVIVGSNVIAAGTDTKVRAIDLESGAIRWTADSRSSSFGAGVCRTSIFVSAFYLLRFDAVTGAITGQADRNAFDDFFSNVASDGVRAYAVAGRGTFAFDCRT